MNSKTNQINQINQINQKAPALQSGAEIVASFKLGTDPKAPALQSTYELAKAFGLGMEGAGSGSASGVDPTTDPLGTYLSACLSRSGDSTASLCWQALLATYQHKGSPIVLDVGTWPDKETLVAKNRERLPDSTWDSVKNSAGQASFLDRKAKGRKGLITTTVGGLPAVVGYYVGRVARIEINGKAYTGALMRAKETDPATLTHVPEVVEAN